MKTIWFICMWVVCMCTTLLSCTEDEKIIVPAPKPNIPPGEVPEGFSCSSSPDADQPLTLTFKAPASSALYGFTGDVYLHTGVIVEGQWQFVPAGWNENIDKCKFEKDAEQENVWSITLSPSLREWFGSGTTPITQLGVIIRSADGTKKGLETDEFITVTDNLHTGFEPGEVKNQSLPAGMQYGINTDVATNSVTLVLYDKGTDGAHQDYAFVVGDFNNWTLANDETSQMYRDEAAGCWWITLNNLDPSKEYRFQYYVGTEIAGSMRLGDPYTEKILDPNNDQYIPESTYPKADIAYPEKGIGIVSTFKISKEKYAWKNPDFKIKDPDNLMIYELLFRDFTRNNGSVDVGDIKGALAKLKAGYFRDLGVNAIELMPVQEFEGNNSWGYNPFYFFALDKAYGTKEDCKAFIDECHSQGIAVLFDVVYNHATGSHTFARLFWNSSTNKTADNNPWFNVDAPHPFSVFHDFNHESKLTNDFVKRNLKFLLDEYKIDGFRFDLTKGFTNTPCDEATANNYDAGRIKILKGYYDAIQEANPNAVMICEHLVGDMGENEELANYGLKMWNKQCQAYYQTAMGYDSDGSGFENVRWTGNAGSHDGWVSYMESHDEERTAYKQVAYSQEPFRSDLQARMAQLEVNAAFFFTIPGAKMIWQFEELGYDVSINADLQGNEYPDDSHRTDPKPLRWEYFNDSARKRLYDTYGKLMKLRQANPEVFAPEAFREWQVAQGYWDNGRWIRLQSTNGKQLVVVGNFTTSEITVANALPSTGKWYNMETGEEETISSTSVTLSAHSFRVYTTFAVQ